MNIPWVLHVTAIAPCHLAQRIHWQPIQLPIKEKSVIMTTSVATCDRSCIVWFFLYSLTLLLGCISIVSIYYMDYTFSFENISTWEHIVNLSYVDKFSNGSKRVCSIYLIFLASLQIIKTKKFGIN